MIGSDIFFTAQSNRHVNCDRMRYYIPAEQLRTLAERAFDYALKTHGVCNVHTFRTALEMMRLPIKTEHALCLELKTSWSLLRRALETKSWPPRTTADSMADLVATHPSAPRTDEPTVLGENAEADAGGIEPDGADAWRRLTERFDRRIDETEQSVYREVTLKTKGDQPVGILLLGDMHIGSASADYRRLSMLADLMDNPDLPLYAVSIGDVLDSMIWKTVAVERWKTPVDVPEEIYAASYWLKRVADSGKLIGVVAGNHDLVSWRMTGFSHLDAAMSRIGKKVPYHPFEMLMTLSLASNQTAMPAKYKLLLRHKVSGNSMWCPSQGVAKQHRFDHHDADIIVAGHTHRSGAQELMLKGKRRWGVQLGSFKRSELDDYAMENGFTFENLNPDYTAVLWPNQYKIEVLPTEMAVKLLEGSLRSSANSLQKISAPKTGPAHASSKSNTKTARSSSSSAKARRPSKQASKPTKKAKPSRRS
jgi:UDP-2,3-diacylglucosamine pyrophosphatase LpxH